MTDFSYLLKEKQELFKDFCIPWDNAIERRLATEMERRPNGNPEIILDNICHEYIKAKLEV